MNTFFLYFHQPGIEPPIVCMEDRGACLYTIDITMYYVARSKIYLNMTDSENFKNYGNIMKDMTDKYLKSHTWINSLF